MSAATEALRGLDLGENGVLRMAVRGGLVRLENCLLQAQGTLQYIKIDKAGDLTASIVGPRLKNPQVVLLLQRFYRNEMPPGGEAELILAAQVMAQKVSQGLTDSTTGEDPEQ